MLRFDLEALEGANAVGVVDACTDLLSLAYCGLYMATYEEGSLMKNGVDPVSVSIGAMKIVGACSGVLAHLTGNDLLEDSASKD